VPAPRQPARRWARAFKLTPHQQQEARQRREAGETITPIAKSYAVHHSTISRLCA
jgi:IS30 family transposase